MKTAEEIVEDYVLFGTRPAEEELALSEINMPDLTCANDYPFKGARIKARSISAGFPFPAV